MLPLIFNVATLVSPLNVPGGMGGAVGGWVGGRWLERQREAVPLEGCVQSG